MTNLTNFKEYLTLFLIGGCLYVVIEIIYRGFSHISMFIVGGICFLLISSINDMFSFKLSLLSQMLIGSIIITSMELFSGIIINLLLKLNVWDYSYNRFNFLGQVCLQASITWFFLSLPAIYLGNFIKSVFNN